MIYSVAKYWRVNTVCIYGSHFTKVQCKSQYLINDVYNIPKGILIDIFYLNLCYYVGPWIKAFMIYS
jgi:hypothetical protein